MWWTVNHLYSLNFPNWVAWGFAVQSIYLLIETGHCKKPIAWMSKEHLKHLTLPQHVVWPRNAPCFISRTCTRYSLWPVAPTMLCFQQSLVHTKGRSKYKKPRIIHYAAYSVTPKQSIKLSSVGAMRPNSRCIFNVLPSLLISPSIRPITMSVISVLFNFISACCCTKISGHSV